MPNLPKSLTLEEKKFLLAVERGDMGNVRRQAFLKLSNFVVTPRSLYFIQLFGHILH